MNQETKSLLSLPALQGRIPVEICAAVLGFTVDGIYALIARGKLKPLGRPRSGAPKWFSSEEIESLRKDRAWLSMATDVVYESNAIKNHKHKRREMGKVAVA